MHDPATGVLQARLQEAHGMGTGKIAIVEAHRDEELA